MKRDDIYAVPRTPMTPFTFNAEVVDVFDDMILRSVPGYQEILSRQAEMAARFYTDDSLIYDLGCSTGNFGAAFTRQMGDHAFHLISVDSSLPMMICCRSRLCTHTADERFSFVCSALEHLTVRNASVVVLNFTLQFVPIEIRAEILQTVAGGLRPGGILLFSEKTTHPDSEIAKHQVDTYYRFKADNGYSELEISQKREALEDILIPESPAVHIKRLSEAGFGAVDIWYKWFNFMSLICRKIG
ncbi:MAG: carboxy-S-adenosyl-L-methionine synthase CmoA [Deltaproteobacteria bacterium]|nr:MAG: carboxy-S-adenosyl-L-methionine synthase CmoA [Deltaproteobacteria bacterium]